MEKFPKLLKDQTALIRAEVSTGHILDESMQLVIGDAQKVYTIFDSYDNALTYAKEIIKGGKVECVIYGDDGAILKYVNPEDIIQ